MRIVINEMKKILNIKILLVVALLCTLFYWFFMSYYIDCFPNGHSAIEEVEYSTELVKRYGLALEENEYTGFIKETRQKLISEMEMYIKSNPVFADAGIYSYEDYEKVYEKEELTEAENKAVWTLLGEECDYARFRMQAINLIESWYKDFPKLLESHISEAKNQKEIDRLTSILTTKEYINIMDWHVYENTVNYVYYLAIMTIMAVLVLVSPLIVTDRAGNIHLLQFTSKYGRKIFKKQLLAVILSAFIFTTVLIIIFGAVYGKIGTWIFWNSGLTSFFNFSVFWFDITYGQYIVIYIAFLYLLCLGTAAIAFILSRFSKNFITLILKLIPVFAVLTIICKCVFKYTFSPSNLLYRATGLIGIEPIVCSLIFIAGMAAACYLVRRERKVDVI